MATVLNNDPRSKRARAIWLDCLESASRTALACIIVGVITLYGPSAVKRHVAFPAFSYVTVILVVTDATLGDTLHGCWLALYATVQSVGPAILSLYLIGPTRLTSVTTAVAVGLASYVVALPEGTHLIAKRIALGQIVITYVIGFINGAQTEAIWHPVHVAESTAIGVAACVIAMLLPYPRLASSEVKRNCKQLSENVSERVKLYMKAFCAEDDTSALASISQAKLLTSVGAKLLQNIKRYQKSMKWERLPLKCMASYNIHPAEEKLQDLEMPLRGMEMALNSKMLSFPVQMLDRQLTEDLLELEQHICLAIKQAKSLSHGDSMTVPESNAENAMKSLQTLQIFPVSTQQHQFLPSFFFLFCMKLLHTRSWPKPDTKNSINHTEDKKNVKESVNPSREKYNSLSFEGVFSNLLGIGNKSKRLMPAFKCSLSVGLAVLFGLLYSKPDGYWSGLPVAISYAVAREATFKVANIKAQGTVLGTVYGVLGCFLFERWLPVRFLSLLPWFIFSSFLRKSQMYSQAGGISAVIGAVLILGRKNFGTPSEFAIARIVETFIGLSCSILVDLVFQPTRASSLAKSQLSEVFSILNDCIRSMSLDENLQTSFSQNQKRLKMGVIELGKFIGEAEAEPDFWFVPFNGGCYGKILGSLKNMVDLFLFSNHSIVVLEQELQKLEGFDVKEDLHDKISSDIQLMKDMMGFCTKRVEKITQIESLVSLEKEIQKKNKNNNSSDRDIEMGKQYHDLNEKEMEKIVTSYLQHSKEVLDEIGTVESDLEEDCDEDRDHEKEVKSQVVLSLSALGYCMRSLMKETREIEVGIKELLQWENSTSNINLSEISCKIRTLHK